MPWPLKLHEKRPENPAPGDCWWVPDYYPHGLSRQYRERNAHRPPLMVRFPDGLEFCIDVGLGDGNGWDVRGEVANLTVTPSIRHTHHDRPGYHGYITNGVITDDCEGRQFP